MLFFCSKTEEESLFSSSFNWLKVWIVKQGRKPSNMARHGSIKLVHEGRGCCRATVTWGERFSFFNTLDDEEEEAIGRGEDMEKLW